MPDWGWAVAFLVALRGLDAMAPAKTRRPHLKDPRLRRVSAQNCSEGRTFRRTMTGIVQVAFRPSPLSIRDEILIRGALCALPLWPSCEHWC